MFGSYLAHFPPKVSLKSIQQLLHHPADKETNIHIQTKNMISLPEPIRAEREHL